MKWNRFMKCERKERYGRRRSAFRAIDRMKADGVDVENLRVYPDDKRGCTYCGGYHLGNRDAR